MQVVSLLEKLLVCARARVLRRRHAGLAFMGAVGAEIPRFPVVDVRTRFVKNDSRIGPNAAGEPVVKASSEHRPFAAIGMADNANPFWVHLRQRGESVAAMGRDAGEERQRLAVRLAGRGTARVAAGRSDRQGDKTPLRQLVGEVAKFVGAQSDARLRFVVGNENGGEWPAALGHEQVPFRGLPWRNLNAHAMLYEILPVRCGEMLNLWFFDQGRPRPHEFVPVSPDFFAAFGPIRSALYRPSVVELQRRLKPPKIVGKLRRWCEEGSNLFPRRVRVGCQTLSKRRQSRPDNRKDHCEDRAFRFANHWPARLSAFVSVRVIVVKVFSEAQ